VTPLLRRIGRPEHAWQHLALGAVWGWLPCGLVYSALLLAAASGGPRSGALALAAFGVGTLPAVLATAGFGRLLGRLGGGLSIRRTAGALLVVFGLWSILGPWAMQHAHHAEPGDSHAVSANTDPGPTHHH
jgi:sulfite exporter TauE/SafE